MVIYVGDDSSSIKGLLSKIPTRCIIATKSNTNFAFAVTGSKTVKYNQLTRELKKKYAPGTYKYIRGSMSVTSAKTDKESGDVTKGLIVLNIFRGEEDQELPEDNKLKKMTEVSSITINENVEIPVSYQQEFKKPAYDDSEDD